MLENGNELFAPNSPTSIAMIKMTCFSIPLWQHIDPINHAVKRRFFFRIGPFNELFVRFMCWRVSGSEPELLSL